jgi:hypothetical protein
MTVRVGSPPVCESTTRTCSRRHSSFSVCKQIVSARTAEEGEPSRHMGLLRYPLRPLYAADRGSLE